MENSAAQIVAFLVVFINLSNFKANKFQIFLILNQQVKKRLFSLIPFIKFKFRRIRFNIFLNYQHFNNNYNKSIPKF